MSVDNEVGGHSVFSSWTDWQSFAYYASITSLAGRPAQGPGPGGEIIPVSPSGLFGAAVETVVNRFREARAQTVAFGKLIPHRVQAPPRLYKPSPGTSSWREEQKASVAAHASPPRRVGLSRCHRSKPLSSEK